jgi:hypothetical protein
MNALWYEKKFGNSTTETQQYTSFIDSANESTSQGGKGRMLQNLYASKMPLGRQSQGEWDGRGMQHG